jgi:hypothetical protein
MLKITTERDGTVTRVLLEGRLAGPWVDELERYWHTMAGPDPGQVFMVLDGVTFIAPEGKALLARMWQHGVQFHAVGCLTRCIVEEISKAGRLS